MLRGWKGKDLHVVYKLEAKGTKRRGRSRRGWIGSVKDVLHVRGTDIQEARECIHDGSE